MPTKQDQYIADETRYMMLDALATPIKDGGGTVIADNYDGTYRVFTFRILSEELDHFPTIQERRATYAYLGVPEESCE